MRRLITITCVALLAGPVPAAAGDTAPLVPAAAADPVPPVAAPSFAHLNSPRTACTLKGPVSCVVLAPGYYLDEAAWAARETELKRSQDAETRLTAENRSLRGTLASWHPGWMTLVVTLAGSIALGAYLESKL